PPDSRLARAAAAEITAGHQERRLPELRPVEHEIGILGAVLATARPREQQLGIVRLQRPSRHDRGYLLGVDVVLQERSGDTGETRELLHHAAPGPSERTSVMRPVTAAAAAMAGPTRCVRTPRPCRPSKLRLVVETQRSFGLPRSPLPPAHIEQPDSPQKKPASRKMRSS